jgi:hypothetical protein
MLEASDRTVDLGKGGLEMGEDLCRRSVWGLGRRPGRQLGRRAPSRQGGADLALPLVEPCPDTLQGTVTEMAVGNTDGRADAAGSGALQEPPQAARGQAEPADFVRQPDAEGPSATGSLMAVAAKNPPRPQGRAPGALLVEAAQIAVPIQRADDLAVRTRRLLEPLSDRRPFLDTAAKPSLLAHADRAPKIVILPAWGSSGVVAGYDENL